MVGLSRGIYEGEDAADMSLRDAGQHISLLATRRLCLSDAVEKYKHSWHAYLSVSGEDLELIGSVAEAIKYLRCC